jgi:heme-degrading monooxygenase HmoA
MQTVLIDKFIVPEESRTAFLEASRKIQGVLKTLPGFVEGFVYEKRGGAGHDIMTTAVWETEDAYNNAKNAMAAQLQRLGLNPQDIMRRLKAQVERGIYERSPY